MSVRKLLLGVAILLGSATVPTQAATVTFDNRALFSAATDTTQTETFNSFLADVNLSGGVVVDTGLLSVTGPNFGFALIDAGGDNITPVNGTAYVQGLGSGGTSLTFSFASSITAFGVDLFAINDDAERTRIIVDGTTYFLPVVSGNLPSFFGLTSDIGFTSVQFLALIGEDAGFDDVTFGSATASPVPIPAALPLFAAGLSAMGFMGWRRKRRAA